MVRRGGNRHGVTARVDADLVAQAILRATPQWPQLQGDVPSFSYSVKRFGDRPKMKEIQVYAGLMQDLNNLGEGKRFSQSLISGAWKKACEHNYIEAFRAEHGRKPVQGRVDGVKYLQSRSLRMMFSHWKRVGEVPCEDDSDEDDETIRKHLHNSMVIHVDDLDNVPDL
ncbi:unnamed protein product, partial [Prorocentrum cordatum]